MKTAASLGDFLALHPVSAKTGDGIGELRDDLIALLPEGPLYFPAGRRRTCRSRRRSPSSSASRRCG